MSNKNILFLAGIFAVLILSAPAFASASATLFLTPASGTYYIGNTFTSTLKVNSGGTAINAVEADLTFDPSLIHVSSISTSSSILTLWSEAPSYSNSAGTIHFSGGLPSPGYSGSSGTVITITFTVMAQGTATVSYGAGSQVLANDGIGTNIFGSATDGVYTLTPVPLSVSCSAAPNPAIINQTVTFSSSVSGGDGSYSYTWSNACTGSSSSCSTSFGSTGTNTANLSVTSGSQTKTATCSVVVNYPTLTTSCSANPSSALINTPITFSVSASGGDGTYAYSWTNACTGSSSTCVNSFATQGTKTATILVSSGGQNSTKNCPVSITLPALAVSCTPSATFINLNDSETFTAMPSGGDGTYAYSWTNNCIGSSSTCTSLYAVSGIKKATITVTSGGLTATDDCLIGVTTTCSTDVCPTLPTCPACPGQGGPTPQVCPAEKQCPAQKQCPTQIQCPVLIQYPTCDICPAAPKCSAGGCPAPIKCPALTQCVLPAPETKQTAKQTGISQITYLLISLLILFLIIIIILLILLVAKKRKKDNETS